MLRDFQRCDRFYGEKCQIFRHVALHYAPRKRNLYARQPIKSQGLNEEEATWQEGIPLISATASIANVRRYPLEY